LAEETDREPNAAEELHITPIPRPIRPASIEPPKANQPVRQRQHTPILQPLKR
jgi:hypothetical protein